MNMSSIRLRGEATSVLPGSETMTVLRMRIGSCGYGVEWILRLGRDRGSGLVVVVAVEKRGISRVRV
jgi:hypothetical protein